MKNYLIKKYSYKLAFLIRKAKARLYYERVNYHHGLYKNFMGKEADKLNDIAKFMAGIDVDEGSALFGFTQNDIWKNYSFKSSANRKKLNSNIIDNIKSWSDTELKVLREKPYNVFYPFGGPDIIYPLAFFPDAQNYLIIGKEPVGVVPDPESFGTNSLSYFLNATSDSSIDICNKSFSITGKMIKQLNNRYLFGVTPVIMKLLALADFEIIELKHFKIVNGEMRFCVPEFKKKPFENKGVEVLFKNNEKGNVQKLLYFCADLSNNNIVLRDLLNFTEIYNQEFITFIKSAEYLLHRPEFNSLREFLMHKSKTLVQDDTGVPIKYFNSGYELLYYGSYIKRNNFKKYFQNDLSEKYNGINKNVNFKFGYGWNNNNIIVVKNNNYSS